MLRKTLMSAALLATAACAPTAEQAFRDGLPTTRTVEVKTPGGATGQALTGDTKDALVLGQTSEFFAFTLGATVTVNGATAWWLKTLEAITDHRPTRLDGDVAVWGPYDSHDGRTWRLTVTRTADTTFSYVLDARATTADDATFRTVVSGTHTAATDTSGDPMRHYGQGTFLVDWDASATLPANDGNVGTLEVTYSRPSDASDVAVSASFHDVKDDENPGQRTNAEYRFAATPGQGGRFEFAVSKNYIKTTSAAERMSIRSRWTETGAGRADVRLSGGDLSSAGAATGSDCWDAFLKSRYAAATYDSARNYGSESACAFTPASYSDL